MAVLLLLYRAWELLPSPPRFLPVLVLLLRGGWSCSLPEETQGLSEPLVQ